MEPLVADTSRKGELNNITVIEIRDSHLYSFFNFMLGNISNYFKSVGWK